MATKPKATRGPANSKVSQGKKIQILLEGMESRLESLIRSERDRTASLIDAAVDSLALTVHIGFDTVEKQFNAVGTKFELMNNKIDQQHADLKGYIKNLDSRVRSIDERLATVEYIIGLGPKLLSKA